MGVRSASNDALDVAARGTSNTFIFILYKGKNFGTIKRRIK
jgi:hypothetical protein